MTHMTCADRLPCWQKNFYQCVNCLTKLAKLPFVKIIQAAMREEMRNRTENSVGLRRLGRYVYVDPETRIRRRLHSTMQRDFIQLRPFLDIAPSNIRWNLQHYMCETSWIHFFSVQACWFPLSEHNPKQPWTWHSSCDFTGKIRGLCFPTYGETWTTASVSLKTTTEPFWTFILKRLVPCGYLSYSWKMKKPAMT